MNFNHLSDEEINRIKEKIISLEDNDSEMIYIYDEQGYYYKENKQKHIEYLYRCIVKRQMELLKNDKNLE